MGEIIDIQTQRRQISLAIRQAALLDVLSPSHDPITSGTFIVTEAMRAKQPDNQALPVDGALEAVLPIPKEGERK